MDLTPEDRVLVPVGAAWKPDGVTAAVTSQFVDVLTQTPAVCRICSLRKNPSNGELGLATSNCLQVRSSFNDGGK